MSTWASMDAPGFDQPVCQVSARFDDVIGAACDNCQHTNLLHRSISNPVIEFCVVCVISNMAGLPRASCRYLNKRTKRRCLRGWGHDSKHAYVDPKGVLSGR